MPTALEQQTVMHRLAHGAAEIDAGNRTPRAGADAARLQSNRKCRASVTLLQPRRHQTDHAGMPALAGGDDDCAFFFQTKRRQSLGFRLFNGAGFYLAALIVETVEFTGVKLLLEQDPADESAVKPFQRHHVGNGAKRHQMQQRLQLRLRARGIPEAAVAQFTRQRNERHEHETNRREMAEAG